SSSPAQRYKFMHRDDLVKMEPAPYLVDGVLVQNSLSTIVGAPGNGKTFLTLGLALSIASGQPSWLGRRLNVSGPVVYVLGEGGGRFGLRVKAWEQDRNITVPYPFFTVNEAVPLADETEAEAFIREVAALAPKLIVFDTLSRCLAGADENIQKDM